MRVSVRTGGTDGGLRGGAGVEHRLEDAAARVDEPVVHLQQREARLAGDLPLLLLRRVRMLRAPNVNEILV